MNLSFRVVFAVVFRHLPLFCLCATMFISANANALDKPVLIGVINYPPHVTIDNGKITGPAVQYISDLMKKAGVRVHFEQLPRKRLLTSLSKGKVDLAFPVPQGVQHKVNYIGDAPMSNEIPGLCFKKADYIPFLGVKSLWNHLRIVYPGGIEVIPLLRRNNPKLTEIVGEGAMLRSLKLVTLGRVDAAYVPNVSAVYHVNSPFYADIACSSFYGYISPVYLAASKQLAFTTYNKIQQAYRNLPRYRRTDLNKS